MWLWLCSVAVLNQEIPNLIPTNKTRKGVLFSSRMFAAEMLFHKLWSRQVRGSLNMLLPRPHPPEEGGLERIWESLWVPSNSGFFCRERGPWWGLNMSQEWGFSCLSCVRHWASLSPLLCFLGSTDLHPWLQQCKSMMVAHYPSPTQAVLILIAVLPNYFSFPRSVTSALLQPAKHLLAAGGCS